MHISFLFRYAICIIFAAERRNTMGNLRSIWNIFSRHKYLIVMVSFLLFMGFVDENSLWNRYQHRLELMDLRSQIRSYTEMFERDTRYLKEIEANPEALSKIARERYYMKADNEDVFVLESDTHE